jgi:hypothetical protein
MPQGQPPDPNTVRRYQENDDESAELDAKKQHQQDLLDEALTETFPASDPISVATPNDSKPKQGSVKDTNSVPKTG